MGRKEMFRDFSDEAKQKLLKYVDEVTADGTWDRVKDWFGDAGLTIQSWLGQLSIQNYVNDVAPKKFVMWQLNYLMYMPNEK